MKSLILVSTAMYITPDTPAPTNDGHGVAKPTLSCHLLRAPATAMRPRLAPLPAALAAAAAALLFLRLPPAPPGAHALRQALTLRGHRDLQ